MPQGILAYIWSDYFFDPVLRGPTIGSMLMCLGSALIGVIVFLRRRSLLGESLSHAAYPGVILGALFAGLLGIYDFDDQWITLCKAGISCVMAFLSSYNRDLRRTR